MAIYEVVMAVLAEVTPLGVVSFEAFEVDEATAAAAAATRFCTV